MTGARASRLITIPALSALAFLSIPCSPGRADFESGREAYLRGDYANAFDYFYPSAMHGNTKSRIGLGLLLARGQGTKADYVGSYSWFDMAADEANGEHVVVRILARTNRDFLKKQMTAEQVARAKLRSTMILATPEIVKHPAKSASRTGRSARTLDRAPADAAAHAGKSFKASAAPASDRTRAGPNEAAHYQIQIAALPDGYPTELRSTWLRLTRRHSFLRRLQPDLVRINLGDSGVYDALRVGPFDNPRSALATCDVLIADSQDCFVVGK
jgi:hypothetical protein